MAIMTLVGMSNYYDRIGKDFFSTLTFPEGIDKNTVVNRLLFKSGDFGVIYSHPEFVHLSFIDFSKTWEHTFAKWHEAITSEYNPIENYDRYEEWTDKSKSSLSKTGSEKTDSIFSKEGSETESKNIKGIITVGKDGSYTDHGQNTSVGDEKDTHYVSAYNSDGDTFDSRNVKSFDNRHNANYEAHTYGNNYNIGDDSLVADPYHESTHYGYYRRNDGTYGEDPYIERTDISYSGRNDKTSDVTTFEDRVDNSDSKSKHKAHIHGNIGVKSSQQMVEESLQLYEWNLYEHIVDIIIQEYCILVY